MNPRGEGRALAAAIARAVRFGCLPVALVLIALPAAAAAAPPPNDNFSDATVWMGEPTLFGTNVEATAEPGEPDHTGLTPEASVWYQATFSIDGTAIVDTCDSDFDTLLAVYTASGPVPPFSNLAPVASDDDGCGFQSSVTFNVTAGTTYYVAVDGLAGDTGNVALSIRTGGPGAGIFKGQTDQGRGVTLRVGDDGLANRVKVRFQAGCNFPATFIGSDIFKRADLSESTPTSFVGEFRFRSGGGPLRVRERAEITGQQVSGVQWSGTFETTLKVSLRGRFLGSCRARDVSWSATLT